MMIRFVPYVLTCAALTMMGCAPSAAPDTRAADEAAIRKADADWAKAGQAKSVDAWMAFYAPDAVVLPMNDKMAATPEAIRAGISGLLAMPGLNLTWSATKVEVAKSGDMGYLYGTYQMSFTGPDGKPGSDTGKIVEIWKKQGDGSWKCAVDTYNSDLPLPTPAPAPISAKKR